MSKIWTDRKGSTEESLKRKKMSYIMKNDRGSLSCSRQNSTLSMQRGGGCRQRDRERTGHFFGDTRNEISLKCF